MLTQVTGARLTPKQAASAVGVHIATIWRWMLSGVKGKKLRSLQIGGRRYVLLADLEEFCLSSRSLPAAPRDFQRLAKQLDEAGL